MKLGMHRQQAGLRGSIVFAAVVTGCATPDVSAVGEPRDEEGVRAQATDGSATAGDPAERGDCKTFDSSFAAIQELIFERKGCTANACHGTAKVGGLDLRKDAAWESLVDAASVNSTDARIQPGTSLDSFLYKKLAAATHPDSVQIAGSPMPVGTPPLTERELEAVALWIQKGAPKTGVVVDVTKDLDVGKLLDACLPPAKPVKIKPLEPPAPSEGVQLVLPRYLLKADSEVDNCTPFVYDFSKQVPPQFKDEARNVVYVNSLRVRQDAQSHHLIVNSAGTSVEKAAAENGPWACRGGDRDAASCDPQLGGSDCGGGGVCAGKTYPTMFCGGEFTGLEGIDLTALADPARRAELLKDPAVAKALQDALAGGRLGGLVPTPIASTQSPQDYVAPIDGVYWEVPLRGVAWFNSHAFNLQDADTVLEARVNLHFADKRERLTRSVPNTANLFIAAGQPPFTRKSYCAKAVIPQGYSIASLSSHTHRRGEHFWVNDQAGKRIYENFTYNDPVVKRFDDWLVFDAADPAQRTLEYCSTFNNGLTKDDKPDLNLVTRASRMPERTTCKAVACVAGKVTAACEKHSDCDSFPGRGDGSCDACAITAGQTTENEMFVLMPRYVLPPRK